ncbi:hypothetical protein EAF00_005354 [Botryotinia globosa]|nr:hypothetical protein EAF00_005354 [Botryotinia globosa]
MPEVSPALFIYTITQVLMRTMQAEQTTDGGYEYLEYHSFTPIEDERCMSWKGGSGSIIVAPGFHPRRTNEDTEDGSRFL